MSVNQKPRDGLQAWLDPGHGLGLSASWFFSLRVGSFYNEAVAASYIIPKLSST